jgi:multiple sugar transport system permease protein
MSDGSMTLDAAIVPAAAARRVLPAHGSRRTYSAYALVTSAAALMLVMLLGPLAGVTRA